MYGLSVSLLDTTISIGDAVPPSFYSNDYWDTHSAEPAQQQRQYNATSSSFVKIAFRIQHRGAEPVRGDRQARRGSQSHLGEEVRPIDVKSALALLVIPAKL